MDHGKNSGESDSGSEQSVVVFDSVLFSPTSASTSDCSWTAVVWSEFVVAGSLSGRSVCADLRRGRVILIAGAETERCPPNPSSARLSCPEELCVVLLRFLERGDFGGRFL